MSDPHTAYEVKGPPHAPVVVLVHGLGLNMHTWDQHVPLLVARYRVVRYDLCGHGNSPMPSAETSLTSFSDQLHHLLTQLEIERCAVVGFSLGGMINRRFALDHPEAVWALAILNSPHERTPEAQRLVEQQAVDAASAGPGANIDTTINRWFTADFQAAEPAVMARVREWVLSNDPAAYSQSRYVLAAGVTELLAPDPPITCPTLVMTCQNDSGSTPAMSEAIASEIAGSLCITVPRLQHMGLMEQPRLFTEPLIRFLDSAAMQH